MLVNFSYVLHEGLALGRHCRLQLCHFGQPVLCALYHGLHLLVVGLELELMLDEGGEDFLVVVEHFCFHCPPFSLNRCNFLVNLFKNSKFIILVVDGSF